MAKDIIEQPEPHIREIVRICRVREAEGRELDELNELVGRTSLAIYVSFVPYEGEPEKRTFSNKTASTELLAVAPLVAVAPGDFLGIFPGRLRYTDQKPTRAIRGPVPNLWLDHSEAMGKLNKMKVAKAGEMTNVCLAWEGVNEVKGEKSFCQYLRVLVIATRHILPFDQLVRPSSGTAVLSAEDGRLGSRGRE